MTTPGTEPTASLRDRHARVAAALVLVACGMLGLAYASVPLYRLICQATGFGGTTQRAERAPAHALDRVMTIRFDANVAADMPWEFAPLARTIDVRIGESTLAFYTAHNPTTRTVAGTATFNVTPEIAGAYFNKIDCFCFSEQVLEPGETVEMAVSFFVDPAIVDEPGARDLGEITLSYTFFNSGESPAPAPRQANKQGS